MKGANLNHADESVHHHAVRPQMRLWWRVYPVRLSCAIVEKEAPGLAEGVATTVQATCYGDPSSDCLLLLQHCGLHSAAASVTVRTPPSLPPIHRAFCMCVYVQAK